MRPFADTSFLLSIVTQDEQSGAAKRWWGRFSVPLVTSVLVVFEAENGLRSMHLRGVLSETRSRSAALLLDRMIRDGSVISRHPHTRLLAAEARRLVAHFSPGVPHGALDVLHLAAARLLKADTLASFDKNQRALDRAAGLKVVP